jgi:hypothetical protein
LVIAAVAAAAAVELVGTLAVEEAVETLSSLTVLYCGLLTLKGIFFIANLIFLYCFNYNAHLQIRLVIYMILL